MIVHRKATPSSKFASNLNTWVKKGTVRVQSVAQEHNTPKNYKEMIQIIPNQVRFPHTFTV